MSLHNHRDAFRSGQASIDFRAALWPSRIPRDYVGLITLRTGKVVFWTGRMAIGLHHTAAPTSRKLSVKDRLMDTEVGQFAQWLIGRSPRRRATRTRHPSHMVFTLRRVSPKTW
jgi:hypothetical protein